MFSILMAAALMAAAQGAERAAPLSCPPVSQSVAAALALYQALPARLEDDPAPVGDLAFLQALAAPRGENDALVRWRFRAPAYEPGALADGVEAACAAVFDVATSGRAINIATSCTSPRFEPGMRRAMQAILFLPALKDGVPVVERRIAQPVTFCMDD